MKRTLSALLSLLLIVTTVFATPITQAAADENIIVDTLNKKYSSTYDDEKYEVVYKFIPSSTGYYEFVFSSDEYEDSIAFLFVYDKNYTDIDYASYESWNEETKSCNITAYLTKGSVYYIETDLYVSDYASVTASVEVKKHTHKLTRTVEKAEYTSYGSYSGMVTEVCSGCDYYKWTTVPSVSSIKLSATAYVYNGKAKTPTVTVRSTDGKALVKNTDYTVTYAKGRKNVGKYKVTIKFKGNYKGSKVLYFTIKPQGTSISSLTSVSKGFTVKWKKQATQTSGYQVQYSTNSSFSYATTKTVSGSKTTSKKITGLTGKKKYFVRVRTYKTIDGTKYYSSWSGKKSVTTKAGASSKPSSSSSSSSSSSTSVSSVVYITPTGKCYHNSKSCAGKNAMKRNLSDVSGSYKPCSKCVG